MTPDTDPAMGGISMDLVHEPVTITARWTLYEYEGEITPGKQPGMVVDLGANLMLNEGIGEMIDVFCGLGGTAFSSGNARIGVGDSSTAAAAGQTDLQAGSNKLYKAMNPGYPSRSGQTVSFQADYGTAEANFAWNEGVVDNGAGAAKTLNRKVSAMGTKTSANSRRLQVDILFQ